MSSGKKPWWRPSPSMVVAVFAVFLALGGTATALSGKFSVKRDDIAPKAVSTDKLADKSVATHKIKPAAIYSKQIKDGNVGSYKLRLNGVSSVAAEGTTTSKVPVDLGGPNTTVKVPEGAMVAIQAEASMRATGNNTAKIDLYEPTLVPNPSLIMSSGSAAFQSKFSTPGTAASGADAGVGSRVRAGWIVMPSSAGTRLFSMRYSTTGGTAIFKDRKLTVTVIR
ncbi:MAG: hypothetical protein JJE13_00905 [Thermoleophilia bacterium]|nr:hypothetical protein [Thermoleophilia bacterium]